MVLENQLVDKIRYQLTFLVLDVLAFRKTGGKIDGDILLNGQKIESSRYHRYIAYVEQADLHYPFHTVLEALEFSAKSRLSENVTSEEREALIRVIERST